MKPLYHLNELRHQYGGRIVLDLPSLSLEREKIYAVTGANGAGKSSLLQILAFLIAPSSGELAFNGDLIVTSKHLASLRQRVTLLSQSPYLLRGSVSDNIEYGLRLRGVATRERQEKVREALAEVGLSGFADRRAKDLSGGEQQRVALARALVIQPQVLLLDEPCNSLDIGSAARIEMLLRHLPRRGTTVIISTHDLQQGARLGATSLHLAEGRLVAPPAVLTMPTRQEKSPWLSVLTMQEA